MTEQNQAKSGFHDCGRQAIWVCYRHSMTLMSFTRCLSAAGLAVLVSCAAPKAVAVADPPKKNKTAALDGSGNAMPLGNVSRAPQDKIRLPDNFLSMPGDTEFRPTAPANTSAAGAVTVRPPSDPVIPPDIGPKTD
jgi:hypothetical protein